MLAKNIQDQLLGIGSFSDRGAKMSGFYVLKHTTMPAVLIEMGFISNPDEEKMLNTSPIQQQFGQGIVQGLDTFFTQASKKGGGS